MWPNTSECFIFKDLYARIFPSFRNAILKCSPSIHSSYIDKHVWWWSLPWLKSLTKLWSICIHYTFKCLSRCCQSSRVPSFANDCGKLVTFSLCTFESFALKKIFHVDLLHSPLNPNLSQYIYLGWITLSIHSTTTCSLRANLVATWAHVGIFNTNSFGFTFHHHLINNETHPNGFHNVMLTQIDIAWSNYLIYVEHRPTGSRMVSCFRIHDPLIHRHQMHSILRYEWVVIILFDIINIFLIVVLCLAKNTMWPGLLTGG